ncbi:MAG: transposase [Deltaproteobacteria bacterium]|nr:transposase [Deltaproteobacteria bacterium]
MTKIRHRVAALRSGGENRTFKDEHTRRSITPLRRDEARARWSRYFDWYDEHRPHEALNGRTPNEVYHARAPANEAPRHEPRPRWPEHARTPCARPLATARVGLAPKRLELVVRHLDDERTLPVVELKRAA